MKIVMTLLVRDEEDTLAVLLDYHFAQGVDLAIVGENLASPRIVETLRAYERVGRVHLLHQESDSFAQADWVTSMARLAVTRYQADWVLHSDADEFWWPLRGSLRSTLEAAPEDCGVVVAQRHDMLPRPPHEEPFYERQIYRKAASRNAIGEPLPPKIGHRGHPFAIVDHGNHRLLYPPLGDALRDAIVIFHFPMRSYSQFEAKIIRGAEAVERNRQIPRRFYATWRRLYERHRRGDLEAYYREQLVADDQIEPRLQDGTVIADVRLRSYLREMIGTDAAKKSAD